MVTVIHRDVAGQKHWDRRLDVASFDASEYPGADSDLHAALSAALEELLKKRSS